MTNFIMKDSNDLLQVITKYVPEFIRSDEFQSLGDDLKNENYIVSGQLAKFIAKNSIWNTNQVLLMLEDIADQLPNVLSVGIFDSIERDALVRWRRHLYPRAAQVFDQFQKELW